jgi:hypothetical protein
MKQKGAAKAEGAAAARVKQDKQGRIPPTAAKVKK